MGCSNEFEKVEQQQTYQRNSDVKAKLSEFHRQGLLLNVNEADIDKYATFNVTDTIPEELIPFQEFINSEEFLKILDLQDFSSRIEALYNSAYFEKIGAFHQEYLVEIIKDSNVKSIYAILSLNSRDKELRLLTYGNFYYGNSSQFNSHEKVLLSKMLVGAAFGASCGGGVQGAVVGFFSTLFFETASKY